MAVQRIASTPHRRESLDGADPPADHWRGTRAPRARQPLAGQARCGSERHRSCSGALHVGSHVLRVVHSGQQGRHVDHHQVLRRLLFLRHRVPLDRFHRGRGRHRADRRPRFACRAQVSNQLSSVQHLSQPYADDAPRRHHAVVLAGVHRFRVVLPCFGTPVHHADPSRPHRAVRVGRQSLERSFLAAVYPAVAGGRVARRHRPLPLGGQMGLACGA